MFGLASFLAHNEFQALQFIPQVILPQIFLSDMIWDIDFSPPVPVALLLLKGVPLWQLWPQLLTLAGSIVVILSVLVGVGRRGAHI